MSRTWARFSIRFLLYFFTVFALMSINLFGMDSVTREQSSVIFNRVLGHLRPTLTDPPASSDLPKGVSVIVLDQETLDKGWGGSATWPLHPDKHAEILKIIRYYNPRAVFVDIMFKDTRQNESMARFNKQLKKYREGKVPGVERETIPLFLAVDADRRLRADIEQVDSGQRVQVNLGRGEDAFYPSTGYFLTYPAKATTSNIGQKLMAAFAIYNATIGEGRATLPDNPEAMAQDLALTWDHSAADLNRYRFHCDRDHVILSAFALAILNPKALKQVCPPFPTGSALALLGVWDSDKLRKLITDRVVYYGVDIGGAGDFIYSPVHGRLPGVYAHAMAHDNLLDFGTDYKKHTEIVLGLPVSAETIEIAMVAVLIAFMLRLFWRHLDMPTTPPDQSRGTVSNFSLSRYMFFVVLSILIVLCVSVSSFYILNIYSLNWIKVLGLISSIGLLAANRTVDSYVIAISRLLHSGSDQVNTDKNAPSSKD